MWKSLQSVTCWPWRRSLRSHLPCTADCSQASRLHDTCACLCFQDSFGVRAQTPLIFVSPAPYQQNCVLSYCWLSMWCYSFLKNSWENWALNITRHQSGHLLPAASCLSRSADKLSQWALFPVNVERESSSPGPYLECSWHLLLLPLKANSPWAGPVAGLCWSAVSSGHGSKTQAPPWGT